MARQRWWEHYDEEPVVVFGHYWRGLPRTDGRPLTGCPASKPFFGVDPFVWLGPTQRAMCVDYSVGLRFIERLNGQPLGSRGCGLGALRLTPDPNDPGGRGLRAELVFDSGKHQVCVTQTP